MEHRLGRTLRVFLVILATAGFYRLTVMPLVEPRYDMATTALEMTPEEAAAIRARADQRLAALGDIFPEGAWERNEPIVLESRQMRLLFKEYQTLPDGRVNLVPCTLVVLSDRNRVANGPPGRTIVMRAPQGAVLEFDEPFDLKQGRLARLVGGSLRGQVTIRGTPSAPGGEDDIEIVTRDVELDELEVRTGELVQFRYGRSSGSGRGLVAALKPRPGQRGGGGDPLGQGPNVGGVDSIRLDRDVRMRLEGLAGGFLPGDESTTAAPPAADQPTEQVAAAPPPVLVSCRGSLCFNVTANVITLEDHVDVVRATAEGGTDQLACEMLAILLGAAGGGQGEPGRGGLEPQEIQAKGTPVVARSTAAGLEARGARLGYELATRRILLDGTEPVSLVARGTEMEARKIDYLPGAEGALGSLMAVGPGWLRVRSEKAPPAQARWQQWLRMKPDGTGHVVSIAGDADITVETRGRLAAAEMHLWLEVLKNPAAPPRPPTAGPDLSSVKPSRMLARGMVEADTDQVSARTDRLELWFREEAGQPAPQPAPAAVAAQAPPSVPAVAAPMAAPAAPPPVAPPRRGRMTATAALVRGLVTLAPQGNDLAEMSMEGQVKVVEEPLPGADKPGIEIAGEQVQLSRPTRFDARAVVSGRPAIVRGQGLDLTGPLVEFDRGRNRVVVDGAGTLALPMPEGGGLDALALTGPAPRPGAMPAAAAAPGKLDVAWQGRLDFDGRTARFSDQVVAATPETTVRAGVIDVVFDEPFDFGGDRRPSGGRQPEVARVACGGGVKIESEMTDEAGQQSRQRLFVRDLVVERASGNVSGTGPGRLTSTRVGGSPAVTMPTAPGAPPVRPVAAAGRAEQLQYLGVDFQRGLTGNIHRRMMEFHQRVEAIAGPVAGWNDALDPHAAGGLPEGVVAIACDVLGVGQAPPLPGLERNTLELAAGGNVLVEGESFTARSARLTWSEAKDLLVFEGDGRADAQLFRQLKVGGQPSSASAGKILYWRGLNRVDVEDARYLDLDQLGKGPVPQLPGAPAGGQPAPFAPRPVPGT
jgi:hypothetical protein